MKAGWTELRKILSRASERDLIGLICDLYKLNKDNKNYLHAKFFNDTETLDKYKKQITDSLVVVPYEKKPKLANARKAISDYKKASSSINGLLQLIMTYLDCGAFMASKYGYYEGGFYESMQSMFKSALKIMQEHPEEAIQHQKTLNKISHTFEKTGWEFQS